jgi:ABC-type branched-subunit amino acid transport system substrate-binding protein
VALAATLAALGACRSEPVEIKVVETVEVEVVETVEVEKVVEVEKEVTVVATVEVEKVVEVPAEAEEQEYVLGIVLPFTGSLGSFGTGFRNGIELAVEQMNERLEAVGSNIRFTTVNADTEGTPEGAAKGVQTVVQTSGAEAIVGPLTTSEVLGAKQFADENGVVIFAPASSGVAGAIPDDNIFRIMYPPDTFAGQAFSQIALERGYENVVILYLDDPFGSGMVDIFTTQFQENGGGEVATVKYAPEPADLTSEAAAVSAEIARLSDAGKTAFFCVCFLGDAQKLLQQAIVDPVMGSVEWLGIENLASPDLLQDPSHAEFLSKVGLTSVSFADTPNPNTQPFVDAYMEKYGEEPGPFTNYAYDVANIAMMSMLMAGNDGDQIKKVVPFVSSHYIGTQVQGALDENGDQALANYGIFQLNEEGTEFVSIGNYNGADGKVVFDEPAQ